MIRQLAREKYKITEIDRYLSRRLVREMVQGQIGESDNLKICGEFLRVPIDPPLCVMVAGVFQNGKWIGALLEEHIELIEPKIRGILPLSGCHFEAGMLVILWSPKAESDIKTTAQQVQSTIKQSIFHSKKRIMTHNVEIFIGVGKMVNSPHLVHESFKQAKRILYVLPKIQNYRTVGYYPSLGLWSILAELSFHDGMVREYLDTYLNVLNKMKKSEELKKTLEAYLRNEGHLKITADQLNIHPNTIKYRIDKIQDETGFDLTDPEVRLNLIIALRLESFIPKDRHEGRSHDQCT